MGKGKITNCQQKYMKIVFVDRNIDLVRKVREAVKSLDEKKQELIEVHKGDVFDYDGVHVSASNPSFTFGGGLDAVLFKKYNKECLQARKTKGMKRIGNVIFTITVDNEYFATEYRVRKALEFAIENTKTRETLVLSGLGTGIGGLNERTFVKLFITALEKMKVETRTIGKKKQEKTYLWKFLRLDGKTIRSQYGNCTWKVGKWQNPVTKIELCERVYHASELIPHALEYVSGEVLARVEVRGKSLKESDKQVWENMRIVEAWELQKEDFVRIAIYAARQVLPLYEQSYSDKRPRRAIEAAEQWLENPCDENESAARAASAASAASAARAARAASAASVASAAIEDIHNFIIGQLNNYKKL